MSKRAQILTKYTKRFLIPLLFLPLGPVLLAQQQSTLEVKGLLEPVEILRDRWGVNHIYANNQHDLFFAQGYAAAKDRLFQFEMWRRQATGTVAEVFGPEEVERDLGARLFKFRGDLEKELNHYHPQGAEIITAYTDGINAYTDEILSRPWDLPFEFKLLGITPGKWTPEVVISRHQGLLGNINEELKVGMAVAKAGEAKVKELMWFHPGDPDLGFDPMIDPGLLSPDILRVYNAFRQSVSLDRDDIKPGLGDSTRLIDMLNRGLQRDYNHIFKKGEEGSNAWVISGERSASGHPLLANDPHRRLSVPSLRYMVHLVAPGWNVIGGGEPTIPGVSIGHNEDGAWGLTVHDIDGEDLYVYELNPENLKQYRYRGAWEEMTERTESIPVEGRDSVVAKLRYTRHGPVTYIDSLNHRAYAVKGAWMEIGGAPYLASLRMDQAKNWEEFREACSYSHIPGENMMWADRHGDIGWQVVGIGPIRENFSGMIPIPGDGRYEWGGYLPIKDRPHALNPQQGFMATANEHVTPADYPHPKAMSYTWADPFRGDRIREVLSEEKKFDMGDMKALQGDYFSLPARELVPMLARFDFISQRERDAKAILMDWDHVLNGRSIAAGIYAMWEREILRQGRERFTPKELDGLISIQWTPLIRWIQNPDKKFGEEAIKGRDEFLKNTFARALDRLEDKLGPSPKDWAYGQPEYKHVKIDHILSPMLSPAWQGKVDVGPLPSGGNSYTPNVTGSRDNQNHGATFRILADTGNWDGSLMINSPGQSGDPQSPYYNNLFGTWAQQRYFPSYFSRDKIEEVTDKRLVLTPIKQ